MHILGMGDTHKAPRSKTLRECELHSHGTILIRYKLGIKESRFVEVFAHLHLLLLGFFLRSLSTSSFCLWGSLHSITHHFNIVALASYRLRHHRCLVSQHGTTLEHIVLGTHHGST